MSSTPSPRRAWRGLGPRLALWYTGFFIVGSLAVLALSAALLSSSLRARDHAAILAELDALRAADARGGLEAVRREPLSRRLPLAVRALGPDGVARWADIPAGLAPDFSRLPPAPTSGAIVWGRAPLTGDDSPLEVASRRQPDGTTLQAGLGVDEREDVVERLRWIAAAIILPSAALAALGGVLLTARALRPLRALLDAIHAIEAGELDSRVRPSGDGDELDELGAAFNRMLDQVAALVRGMKGALDEAAHEMRTPLTRLRGAAELALREGGAEAAREALADGVEESDRIIALLDALMDLSEAETGTLRLNRAPTDAARLLEDAADLYRDAAEAKGLILETSAQPGLTLDGDRVRLRQALANLLDNAVKYTPSGGHVRASARREEGAVVLSVEDDGPGIPAEDLPRVWDRLYRGAGARGEKGLGLGLSLVRAIALAHGGRVEAQSGPGGGARVRLRLPAHAIKV